MRELTEDQRHTHEEGLRQAEEARRACEEWQKANKAYLSAMSNDVRFAMNLGFMEGWMYLRGWVWLLDEGRWEQKLITN